MTSSVPQYLQCPSCGSQLLWSAEKQGLNCLHCGFTQTLPPVNDQVKEHPLANVIDQGIDFSPEETGKQGFQCTNCGAETLHDKDQVRVSCAFCGSEKVNAKAYETRLIQPIGIIPFKISKKVATASFKKWIAQGWFHPSKLKTLAALEDLHGIYLPFWTYDAQTHAQWSGEAGYYYTVTEQVFVNGKYENRQVTKIRWEYKAGSFDHFFDDVTVVASSQLTQEFVDQILPFQMEQMVNYDARMLSGWESEVYRLDVKQGYERAEKAMDRQLAQMAASFLGGDTQRNLSVQSRKWDHTFKHVLMPIYICSYTYNGKLYRFLVNAQNGTTRGDKPLSVWKIMLVVLIFVLLIGGLYLAHESGYFAQ